MERVLIVGVSTRAAAESAARAGFAVTAIDAFGDLDQHSSVRVVSLEGAFTPHAAARAARGVECEAVVYLANFENHPRAISALAEGRALWGNAPEVIRRVRDPLLLVDTLRKRGVAVPDVRLPASARLWASFGEAAPKCAPGSSARGGRKPDDTSGRLKPDTTYDLVTNGLTPTEVVSGLSRTDSVREWLVKPIASGGGQRIRRWQHGEALGRDCYMQELIDGPPGSVVFVAAGGRAVMLGISRQLVGDQAFGASGYQYCGSILAEEDPALVDTADALARAVTEEFGLVGVNGIDFIVRDRVPYAIEVNPRWCASMELVERAYSFPVIDAHASACAAGELPVFDLRARSGAGREGPAAFGKAVVYARRDVTIGDTHAWLARDDIRDIPHPGEQIHAGRPVCTVFATSRDRGMCHEALVGCAAQIYAQLDAWEQGTA